MIPADPNVLTLLLIQPRVVPMWIPSTAKGAVKAAPKFPSQSAANKATMTLLFLNTARSRKKNKSEFSGRANVPSHAIAFAS